MTGPLWTYSTPTAKHTSSCYMCAALFLRNANNVSRAKKSLSEGALRPSDLLAQFKQTEARTRTQIMAAELLDNTVELIREMVYTHTMVQPDPRGTEQQQHTTPEVFQHLCGYQYHNQY